MGSFYIRKIRFVGVLCLLFMGILLLSTCKTYRKKQSVRRQGFDSDTVINNFKTHEFLFEKLSGKLSVSTDIDGKKQSFTANMRMKKDSVLWVSVSPFFGIEMMRLILTPDSAKAMNRIESTYFLADNNYLKTLLKADIDFKMLQSVLIGNDFPHFESNAFKVEKEDSSYRLVINKRKKLANNSIDNNTTINQVICLGQESFKIIKNTFSDIEEKYKFEIVYSNFKILGNQLFPYNIECKIKTNNQLWKISVEYSRLDLNVDNTYPFVIPDKFTKMP